MADVQRLLKLVKLPSGSAVCRSRPTSSNADIVISSNDRTTTTVIQSTNSMTPRNKNQTLSTQMEILTPTVDELMTDRSNLTCTVAGCGKVLQGPPALRMHLIKSHGIYKKPEERYIFSNPKGSITCTSVTVAKQYYCPIAMCQRSKSGNKPFPKISLLKQHYVGIHAEKIFKCSKCPAKFGMDKIRIKHEESCGVMFKCTCGVEYKTRGALISHSKYQKHPLPANFSLRSQRQCQKELQKQLRKQQEQLLIHQQKKFVKQFTEHSRIQANLTHQYSGPIPILPRIQPTNMVYVVPMIPYTSNFGTIPVAKAALKTIATQTQSVRRKRGPYKKNSKLIGKAIIQSEIPQQNLCTQPRQPISQEPQGSSEYREMMLGSQIYQDSGMNTNMVSAANMETQTSVGSSQSTHTCTQTRGDMIVQNALLSANNETQTNHTQLVQSSTQYNNNYAATAETQTVCPSLSLHQGSFFDFESVSVVNPDRVSHSVSPPTAHTQTSTASVSSSNAHSVNWLSALYETPSHNSPMPATLGSSLTQPSDVPTQTDLSFLDMLNLNHSETQTMNPLAFMTESSSTQTLCINPNPSGSCNFQSTEAQTHMPGRAVPLPLNTSQTQTSFADLCLGDVFLTESRCQTNMRLPFRIDDGISSSHQQTQTGTTWHQSTQTAAEKEFDAALSLLNRYTQTNQTERNDSPRSDSLSELEFTSMHTQTMEDVLAVLDNDNQSTSVQTDFGTFTEDHSSFGVSAADRTTSAISNNSGVAVQTDTLDLSNFQDLDFYSNSNSSSQTL